MSYSSRDPPGTCRLLAAKINREIPELISSLFRPAIALGHGKRDIATVTEVLRAGWPNLLFARNVLQPLKVPAHSGTAGDTGIQVVCAPTAIQYLVESQLHDAPLGG
jgi:hypothetical protein